ncbi:RING-H2 finger protein ATL66 [Neltuma alba]|uniref:RING-H2 finger protein ATL66 n=1 Tax=Neltuma alba TaxID=207710 RepID=UPI0010A4D3CB|nr:RING-H2 finger protein ATL66-like [Prosopis alba]XP_028792721.1 RING-H2 finger protein ATL66-like [Prosopis alba]
MTSQDSQGFTWHYTELDDRNLEIRGRTFFFVVVLFSIILIMTLLFLYARWIWRYRGQHSTTYHSNGARLAPPAPPAQGLDPASIKELPIILHQRTSEANSKLEETECCICLGTFKDGEKLKVLPGCDHSFHCECVDKWLSNHSSCPLCRSSLKVHLSLPKILIQEPPNRINLPL